MRAFCFLLAVLFSSSAWADTLTDKDAAKALAARVMATVAQGKTNEAILLMKPYLIIPDSEFEVMKNQLSMQAPMIEQRFGKSIGSELIKVEEIGSSLMLVMYIQKFEKHMMRWMFYFYRPKDAWVLNTFTTDDNIKQVFCR